MSAPRERNLRKLQRLLERFYELEQTPDVLDFVRSGSPDTRETLVLRQQDDELEIALVLPPLSSLMHDDIPPAPCDGWLQVVEGVSHFVYVAERARTNLPATLLELELQAEVDKYVVIALRRGSLESGEWGEMERTLHAQLYGNVRYLHAAGTEDGDRYRMANDLAARFIARLVQRKEPTSSLRLLRRFYRAGQAEKIHLARAA
ncbi:MAG: hypothetical protein KC776_24275 [Myxococcales bacterium]|nr:hypothetical protein [Myxococcales bacterium]MCB9582782.1 hypothetical protein [Polyangiaceae bacterium]